MQESVIEAEVVRVSTTSNGAFRITLDIPSYSKKAANYLSAKSVDNETVRLVVIDDTVERQKEVHNG